MRIYLRGIIICAGAIAIAVAAAHGQAPTEALLKSCQASTQDLTTTWINTRASLIAAQITIDELTKKVAALAPKEPAQPAHDTRTGDRK